MNHVISEIKRFAPEATVTPFRVGRGVTVKGAKDPAATAEMFRWNLPAYCDVGRYGARILISFH